MPRLPLMVEVFTLGEDLQATSDVGHPPHGPGLEASRDVSDPPKGKGLETDHDVEHLAQSPLDVYSDERWDRNDPDPPGLMIVGGAP